MPFASTAANTIYGLAKGDLTGFIAAGKSDAIGKLTTTTSTTIGAGANLVAGDDLSVTSYGLSLTNVEARGGVGSLLGVLTALQPGGGDD